MQVVIMLLLGLLAKTVMEKSWKFSRLFCQDQDQDQDQDFIFVLEAPRDQDFGLEDYITGSFATFGPAASRRFNVQPLLDR